MDQKPYQQQIGGGTHAAPVAAPSQGAEPYSRALTIINGDLRRARIFGFAPDSQCPLLLIRGTDAQAEDDVLIVWFVCEIIGRLGNENKWGLMGLEPKGCLQPRRQPLPQDAVG